MSISAAPSERDLRTLAGIVSDHRADVPKDGLPLSLLAGLLKAPDAHLVVLKDAFVGFVMPSKIYACLGSGKPLIFV